jgi:cytochrome c oxidase subunit IV
MALDILNWRGKLFWIGMCSVALWTLIIMEAVKLNHETRYIDSSYFWILLTVNLLAHFLLWMSGTPYIYPSENVEDEKSGQEVVRTRHGWLTWDRHPAVHYATGGFGKFFFLLVFLDIFYYGCIMRDQWYEVIRVLVMDATLVVGIFILNSHNRFTTHRAVITLVGLTLMVYNVIMIARTFSLLTHSIDHRDERNLKPLIPIEDAGKMVEGTVHGGNHYRWDMYRGYEHTRLYDMVLYTSLLLFFSIFLKLREKLLYPDHDVLGWNSKIDLRERAVDPERARLITKETIVVNSNPLEA